MHVVTIRQLKTNPSVALREAKHDLVMVTNRDKPVVDYAGEEAEAEISAAEPPC